jgi:hypothetical protein
MHRRELTDMLAAHIDIVLPVYWGSTSEKFWSITGLQKLVQAEQAMLLDGLAPPKIGMFYDTTALQQQNGGIPPRPDHLCWQRAFLQHDRRLFQ